MEALDGPFPTRPSCQLKMGSETVLVANQPEKQIIGVKGANSNIKERKAFLRKFLLQIFSTF